MGRTFAVVGAGAAGIAAGRRLGEENIPYDIFEQSANIGGTWVYDERIGRNEYGEPIHTSMYLNLKTNLPKEIMAFPDFPLEDPNNYSYVPGSVILQYLRDYAENYGVSSHIKFNTKVEEIRPEGAKWMVNTKDLLKNEYRTQIYDVVLICNGHYHKPNIPKFAGIETFSGEKIHSHDYRKPDRFRELNVVVVGAGPSGLDIAFDISSAAKQVYLSHHLKDDIATQFPKNFVFKPDISKISEKIISFTDGSAVETDVLLYCTGYVYNFPFLHQNCGVTVDDNYIFPLYKHVICIRNPTLCFIGLPFYVCANAMFDLQVRFVLASLNKRFKLPSENEMLEDESNDMKRRKDLGFSKRESHKMGPLQGEYYDDLARTAQITGIPPVMTDLHNESSRRFLKDLRNFRTDRYQIINADHFIYLPTN